MQSKPHNGKKQRFHYKEVYSDSESEDETMMSVGDWVVVIYDNIWYPGKILH